MAIQQARRVAAASRRRSTGQVIFDSVAPSATGQTGSSVSSITWSHTVGASLSNTVLLVGVSLGDAAGADTGKTVAVTYGGTSLTSLAKQASGDGTQHYGYVQLFYLVAPAAGTASVVVTSSASTTSLIAGSLLFAGVKQSAPFLNTGSSGVGGGGATTASRTISGAATNGYVVDLIGTGTGSLAKTGSSTNRWLRNLNASSSAGNAAMSTLAGGGGVTMSYSFAADWYGMVTTELAATSAPPVVPPSSGAVLPFDMPDRATLSSSSKKVWYHWMGGAFQISIDDKNGVTDSTEYWRQYWMPPGTTEGAGQPWAVNHNVYGGLVRDRKIPRAPRGTNYEVLDYQTEISQLIASGADGFTAEILSVPVTGDTNPQRWAQLNKLLDAADAVGDSTFTLTLMPDCNALNGTSVTDLVNAIDTLSSRRVTRVGGRLVVAPYSPESLGVTYWTNVLNGLVAKGHNPYFWPCYENAVWSTGQAPTFNSIAQGHSRWGDRDPVACSSSDNTNGGAPAYCHTTYGKLWMHPCSVGDQRPNQGAYTEQRNSDQIVASWTAAINAGANCDWVQVPTWDDFAEGAQICPQQTSGYSWLDLTSFFLVRYKTGTWPTIVRDAIYLNHRRQPTTGVTYTGGQTSFQTSLWGGTATSNQVEALVFATSATGTVSVTVAGNTTSFNLSTMTAVAPGVYSCKVPLAAGSTSATLIRSGATVASVSGPVTIATTQVSQDMSYYGKSSLR